MASICVFCGSSAGHNPRHKILATALGHEISQRHYRLVYGGGGLGLMGATARAAHAAGGDILGIIPEFLSEAEKTLTQVKHHLVPDMHARKIMMFNESDAFIVLPGGIGTLEEAVEILSWMRLNLHSKPLVFLDDTGYWTHFLDSITHFIDEGFAPQTLADDLRRAQTAAGALDIVEQEIARPRNPTPLYPDDNISGDNISGDNIGH